MQRDEIFPCAVAFRNRRWPNWIDAETYWQTRERSGGETWDRPGANGPRLELPRLGGVLRACVPSL